MLDPASLSAPITRRIRRLVLLAAAVAAVALARDRIITDAERRDGERLGLDRRRPEGPGPGRPAGQ